MRQRGFLSAELAQYLIVSILLFIFLVPPLFRYTKIYIDATDINQAVETIQHEAQVHYAKSVLTNRCLHQSTLSIADLNLSLPYDHVSFEVRYLQSGIMKARPSGIQVEVTITKPNWQDIANRLSPDELRGASLIFNFPLNYQLPDWQQLNTDTGCIR